MGKDDTMLKGVKRLHDHLITEKQWMPLVSQLQAVIQGVLNLIQPMGTRALGSAGPSDQQDSRSRTASAGVTAVAEANERTDASGEHRPDPLDHGEEGGGGGGRQAGGLGVDIDPVHGTDGPPARGSTDPAGGGAGEGDDGLPPLPDHVTRHDLWREVVAARSALAFQHEQQRHVPHYAATAGGGADDRAISPPPNGYQGSGADGLGVVELSKLLEAERRRVYAAQHQSRLAEVS